MNIKVLASGSTGNAYRIDDGKTALLMECGIPYKKLQIALGFKVSGIDACLITHEHMDHAKAWKELLKAGVSVYSSQGTKDALEETSHSFKVLKAEELATIGTFIVMPFTVAHDANEPFGYLIKSMVTNESLVFITDTVYSPHLFKDVEYYMVECNYVQEILDSKGLDVNFRNRIRKAHMSLETVLEFFSKTDLSKTKEIYVMHLSDNNSDEELIKTEIQKATGKRVIIC